jgi:two-component system NtrC family sensor kinase
MLNHAGLATQPVSLLVRALFMTMFEHANDAGAKPKEQSTPTIPPERIQEAERLLLSGELLLSLSHEVNNALTVILSNAELLEREMLPPSAHELTGDILTAGRYIKSLLHSMLSAANEPISETQSELGRVLTTIVKVVTPLARHRGVTIEYQSEEELWVALSPHQVQQVLINLVFNSLQAMQTSGDHIWIEAVGDTNHVIITVRDNGPGIPEHVHARMFEPFFSTKPAGLGTGLGLAIVHGVVRQAGGDIEATDTRPGHTTFTLRLPRVRA